MKNTLLIFSLTLISLNLLAQPAGSLDLSFGVGGKVVTSIASGQDKAYGVAIQSDGKIVVAGFTTSAVSGKDFACIRYNTDGSLDNTFGTNGIVTTDLLLGSDDVAYSLELQTDGKIVLAGYCDNGSNKDAALVRYTTDGTLDNTFGTNGIVLTDFDNSQQDEIKVVKIHALTGNIIVGGASIISSSVSKPVVARYLSNGTLDVTFNTTGIRLLWITSLDYQYLFSVEDLEVKSNGKISAVGWRDFPGLQWDSDYWAGRINSDGTMDVTFSSDGVNVYNGGFNGHDKAYSMILRSNDNILIAGGGYISTLKYDQTAFEINTNGTSSSWFASVDFGSTLDDISYGFSEDLNGKFVLAGSSGTSTSKSFAISRINSNATIDNTFGTSGKVTTTFNSNLLNECFDMKIQSDNKIVAVGYTGNSFAIARYLGNNLPDLNNFQLLYPANLATNQNYASLICDWSDAYLATSYEMDLDTDPGFSTSPQTFVVSTSTKTLTNLLPNTQYYWRVRASENSNYGQYSAVWSFTTNSLENFNLISPVNSAINQEYASLPLDWSNAIGAMNYELQVDLDASFSTSPVSYTPTASNYTLTSLLPSTQYFWHVRASNNGTNFGQWSSTWSFTTKAISSASIVELANSPISIYPNPASDKIFLSVSDTEIGESYSIVDITGKELRNGILLNNETVISVNDLVPGFYYISIGNSTQSIKFVKE